MLETIATGGHLNKMTVRFKKEATVVKYLVPQGYPNKAVPPSLLTIDAKKLKSSKAELFYSSVDARADGLYTGSSRALAILGVGKTISEAEAHAEAGCLAVTGPIWHRTDIGTDALIKKRIEHMKELRGR